MSCRTVELVVEDAKAGEHVQAPDALRQPPCKVTMKPRCQEYYRQNVREIPGLAPSVRKASDQEFPAGKDSMA